jgi:hypothetical protein
MLQLVRSSTKPGRERIDSIALVVAAIAVLLVVAAVAGALAIANAPTPNPPTLGPVPTLSAPELTATQAVAATANANEHALAVTLAAAMQVTPGSLAMGISPVGTVLAPDSAQDFAPQNVWIGLLDSEWVSLYAGALRSDPQTGALLLVTVLPDRVDQERFVVPLSNGALRISAQNVQRLTLVSASGAIYYFDVLARRFAGTLTEYAETATAPRFTATSPPTKTQTPTKTQMPTMTLTPTKTPTTTMTPTKTPTSSTTP